MLMLPVVVAALTRKLFRGGEVATVCGALVAAEVLQGRRDAAEARVRSDLRADVAVYAHSSLD